MLIPGRVLGAAVGGAAAVAALALLFSVGPAAAAGADDDPTPFSAIATTPTGVDDFTFDSFSADYTLGRDRSGRSTLATTETLVAVFPDFDQNRGIIRAIPSEYDNHSTFIRVVSVTDGNGIARDYAMGTDGDFTTITIAVPLGQFVHGTQTYVIEYTQVDVTRLFEDTNDDEFYWDTNGTGWDQPFGEISARVHLDSGLDAALTGQTACYFGYEGMSEACEVQATSDGFAASVSEANPRENLTLAIGFRPGTFAAAPFDLFQYVPLYALLGMGALLLSIVLAVVFRFTALRDHPGKGIVIAQYEPQDGVSAWLAANIMGRPKKGMPATIVDLAVRRKLRILERPNPIGRATAFGVEQIDDTGLEPDAQRAMFVLFSTGFFTAASQQVRWFTARDIALGQAVKSLAATVKAEELALGLRRKAPGWPKAIMILLAVGAFVAFLLGGILSNDEQGIVIGVLGANIVPWITIFLIASVAGRNPLTDAGAQVRDHLKGLELYIRLAEADRLQMLQGITGAERVSGAGGGGAIVNIYERLLPYAVIFGLEREWANELEKYYDTTPPDWYSGSGLSGFRVGAFAATIGSFSSTVSSSTSYSSSGSSSSGGGSSGGGSSGGGGGGGGGGGV